MDNLSASSQNTGLVSLIDSLYAPDVYNKLVGRFPKQRSLEWLEKAGRYIPSTNKFFKHHEENTLIDAILIGGVANAAAATIDITLDPSAVYTVSGSSFSSPRVYDRVEFTNGAQGIITAVSKPTGSATHTVTVTRSNSSYTMSSSVIVGEYMTLMSQAGPEGWSGPNEVIVPTTSVFQNQTSLFYDYHQVTTTEEGQMTYLEFTYPEGHPKAGQSGSGYVIKAEADMIDRFMLKRELGLFTNDSASVVINGETVEAGRGFIPHLQKYANLMDYISTPSMTTLDTIALIINKNYGCLDNAVMHGLNFGLGIKNFGTDLFKGGGIIYNKAGEALDTAKLGMKTMSFDPTGHRFHFTPMPIFNHAATTGAPGRKYPDMFIVAPLDQVKDTVTTEMKDSFAIKYNVQKGGGTVKNSIRVWETGGAAPNPTGNDLKRRINISSEEGMQCYAAKRFILGNKKANS